MTPTSLRAKHLLGALALAVAAFAIYWPALRGGWLFDDELDVTGNRLLRTASGLWQIWFQPAGLYDYYPLKYSVQWLQWQKTRRAIM
jgi:protein O-mannosyl-transferase